MRQLALPTWTAAVLLLALNLAGAALLALGVYQLLLWLLRGF